MSDCLAAHFHLAYPGFTLDAQLRVPLRGFSVISGRSGCGKTTLLRCMAGLVHANGELRLGDMSWQDKHQCVPTHQRQLAYVFQEPRLFPHLDVRDNLRFGFDRIEKKQRRIAFDDAVAWLGLATLLSHRPAQLSGGQQQRVAIARALLTSPQLLLMDEPLANLDHDSKAEILPYLEQLRSTLQIPVIYVTHATDEMARLADHLLLMENGRVIASGPLNTLLTQTTLPLAHLDDARAVLDATVTAHDAHYQLTQVNVAGGSLAVALSPHAIGSVIRVGIMARDVSIALQPPQQSSIQNCLAAHILDISPDHNPARVLVRLDCGDNTIILSRITRRAADQLALRAGMPVYAQIKAVALM
ncbi:MAG TPA: molybdenum ABC transporter ATP-binding protein [Pseudomonadales bacterium]|nr:molybdenum ABC transporter ATP-binding protein [Pseudomonadales bacterium]